MRHEAVFCVILMVMRHHQRRPSNHPFRQNHPRQISIPYGEVLHFCRRWKIIRLALFGSVLRKDFRHDSDVDILATFAPESSHTLLDLVQMETELSHILGRRVDLGEREAVDNDTNVLRRESILTSQKVIHEDR